MARAGQSERVPDGVGIDAHMIGQTHDGSTGLMHYNARYYDPQIGRFISADTIIPNPMDPQQLNRYSYVTNNPVLYRDPTGHCQTIDANGVCKIYGNGWDYGSDIGVMAHGLHEGGYGGATWTRDGSIGYSLWGSIKAGAKNIATVADGAWDRAWEFGEYKIDRLSDDFGDIVADPDLGDIVEVLTVPIETLVNDTGAIIGILGGGDVVTGDDQNAGCPVGATCIVDAGWLPFGYKGQAFNEVLVTLNGASDDTVKLHEPQHFYDAEEYGWLLFAVAYGKRSAQSAIHGSDPYRGNSFEQRAYQAEDDKAFQPGWSLWEMMRR